MNSVEERIRKLEEAQAFAEHAGDQILDELRRADQAIERLSKRLAALEARLAALGQAGDGETSGM